MRENLAKTYDPKEFEDRIYKMWEESGSFHAEVNEDKKPFSIVMPPPNITGKLHMGHALDQTLQDVLTRYKRMQGYSALWIPGSDHASIATEVKVVNKIREEEGKTKEDLGREEFLKRVWDWKKEYGGTITRQCRKIGDSCDWSRERFTLDEGCSKAVRTFFVRLYKKGLIYRGNRLINWCPSCHTSLSDAEVEHEDKNGEYWYFRYPAAAEGDPDIVVATSRPETMFGDVAIAVNPKDERYSGIVGKKVILPLVGREIPVIADPYPDPEKGTGAVKITPAHDMNDFQVGQRHNLEILSCIDEDAHMNALAGKYQGMDRYECRKQWVKDLSDAGYLVKIEDMTIPVGTCYRCHTVIEPMMSDQWFVKMNDLAKPALEAVKNGETEFIPERFVKIYNHWLENIQDWCISRQLWWGHRIPAWYCDDCGEIIVEEEDPAVCPKCGSKHIHQDEDVLDTWFSSGLWPFSTLGWPEKTKDLSYFYPTDVLVTGYDIIFFWVVRMMFSGIEATGKAPFKYVYLHGLVRDSQGRKMSKSLGNGIDPLEEIDRFGADALRFMLSNGITPGNDMRYQEEKILSARNFANKLWNASRFVIMNLYDEEGNAFPMADGEGLGLDRTDDFSGISLKTEDQWMISRLNDAVRYVTDSIDKFELALASQRIYDLIWNEFCDWYVEFVKKRLWGDDEEDKKVVRFVLNMVLKNMLELLHPFMPFITEEIWGYLPHAPKESASQKNGYLISAAWPKYSENRHFEEDEKTIASVVQVITAIRTIRNEAEAKPSKELSAYILAAGDARTRLESAKRYILDLAHVSELRFISNQTEAPQDSSSKTIAHAQVFVPLDELVDYTEELERLRKEEKRLVQEVQRAEKKLSNKGFTDKAPQAVVEKERTKKTEYEEMLKNTREQIRVMEAKKG
ncbi:MAG: valine--tRNA ligase [Eubacteriales bacterium]|nr:valine--tRNA ligase [Eubacteriales bacterium]